MATEQLRTCDHCATKNVKDVETYQVDVVKFLDPDVEVGEAVKESRKDLCPRHLERMLGFIERGTKPPAKKESTDAHPQPTT